MLQIHLQSFRLLFKPQSKQSEFFQGIEFMKLPFEFIRKAIAVVSDILNDEETC